MIANDETFSIVTAVSFTAIATILDCRRCKGQRKTRLPIIRHAHLTGAGHRRSRKVGELRDMDGASAGAIYCEIKLRGTRFFVICLNWTGINEAANARAYSEISSYIVIGGHVGQI